MTTFLFFADRKKLAVTTAVVFLSTWLAQNLLLQVYLSGPERLENLAKSLEQIVAAETEKEQIEIDHQKLLAQIKKALKEYFVKNRGKKLAINGLWICLNLIQWVCVLPAAVCLYQFGFINLVKLNQDV